MFVMPSSCYAFNCANHHSKEKGIKFYRYPKYPERRWQWIAAICHEGWQPNDWSQICAAHFVSSMENHFLSFTVMKTNDLITSVTTIIKCLHNFAPFTDDTWLVQLQNLKVILTEYYCYCHMSPCMQYTLMHLGKPAKMEGDVDYVPSSYILFCQNWFISSR